MAIALQSKIQSLRTKAKLIRLRPFDTSTDEGRSNERLRRAALTTLASMSVKVVTMISAVISVPLTLHYLGAERYGLWMTISSFIACLSFADLGLGNGLINAISSSDGKDDVEAAKRYVSSGYIMLSGIALILCIVFSIILPIVKWEGIFNVHSILAKTELRGALIVFFIGFSIGIPMSVVQKVQSGYQEGFNSNIWQLVGAVLGLSALIFFIHIHAGLPLLIFAMMGVGVCVNSANTLVYFIKSRPWLFPKFQFWDKVYAKKLLSIGLLFFVLQIAITMTSSVDNIIIANFMGAKTVPDYAVPNRLFTLIGSILGMMMMPLWPAFGEAWSRGNHNWVSNILKKALFLTILITVVTSLLFAVFSVSILHLWVGKKFVVSMPIIYALALWTVLSNIVTVLSIFLNGINKIKLQLYMTLSSAVIAIILKFILIRHFGIVGIISSTIVGYVLCWIFPCVFILPKFFNQNIDNDL